MMRVWRTVAIVTIAVLLLGANRVAAAPDLRIERRTLGSGVPVLISEQRNLPMVMMRIILDAGARRDPPGREGLAHLTADLLGEGTETRSAEEINEQIDFLGASLDTSAGTDSAQLSLRVLEKDLDEGLELITDLLLHPAFAAEEIERRREAAIARIRDQQDDPTTVAAKTFRRTLHGDGPYGHPADGSEESLREIEHADIVAFHRRHYGAGSARIVIVGDIAADEATRRLDARLADWSRNAPPPFTHPEAAPVAAQTVRVEKNVNQAAIVLGHRGIARDDPDYETLRVMNYTLGGGGFSSRLVDRIRTQAGLAYSVGSYFVARAAPGSFRISMQTKSESVGEAIGMAREELVRMREEGVGTEELEEAKRYLTGSFALELDSNSDILGFMAEIAIFDLPLDYAERYRSRIDAVTRADVHRVARKHLHPDRLIEVVVGDSQAIDGADPSPAAQREAAPSPIATGAAAASSTP